MRDALRAVAPELAGQPVALAPTIEANPPLYWRGTARVGAEWVAKFAWSAPAAVGIERELRMLRLLPDVASQVPAPALAHASLDPLLFVTRYVDGVALGDDREGRADGASRVAEQLADALAALHRPEVRDAVVAAGAPLAGTDPQSTTAELRDRFAGTIVTGARASAVLRLCDWTDRVLAAEREPVVLHGDMHGHNVVVSHDGAELLLVADFESAALGDRHYDFRYLPSLRRDVAWLRRAAARYEATSGAELSMARVMAWHVRTALGDALWRTERGVPLPGAPTPEGYVDDVVSRMAALALTFD